MLRCSRLEEFPLPIRVICSAGPPVRRDLIPRASVSGFLLRLHLPAPSAPPRGDYNAEFVPFACKAVGAQIEGKRFDPSKYALENIFC